LDARGRIVNPDRFTPTGVGTAEGRIAYIAYTVGSPPRAWGRLIGKTFPCRHVRFTPTGVGTAGGVGWGYDLVCGSPPRAWGRLLVTPPACIQQGGSPPRAWGRRPAPCGVEGYGPVHPHGRGDGLSFVAFVLGLERFTPTGVGTASIEYSVIAFPLGSPPRAWGRRNPRGF